MKFVRKDFQFVAPYDPKDIEARYAVRLRFENDLEDLWKDPNHTALEISIYCENEMNGVGKVFRKVYSTKRSILEGTYKTGKSTELIPD